MKLLRSMVTLGLAVATSRSLPAQTEAVKLVEVDDGMISYVYAYVRAEVDPIALIDQSGITFDRDPVLAIACVDKAVAVVYRFDTELMGENEMVRVQYRFPGQSSSEAQGWPILPDPTVAQGAEIAGAILTGESAGANPFLQMISGMATAARIPADLGAEFLAGAEDADQVTVRVTDPFDGETHTDVFPLVGFADALRSIRSHCEVQ